jgi:heparan-alpha-glucosaminide N-acetyltransferase
MSWTELTSMSFRNLNLKELRVDQAYFNVSNAANQSFFLYTLSDECIKCPFKKFQTILPNKENVFKISTKRSIEMKLFDKDWSNYLFPNETKNGLMWSGKPELGQFGVYDLKISEFKEITFEVAKEPVNIYTCKLQKIQINEKVN